MVQTRAVKEFSSVPQPSKECLFQAARLNLLVPFLVAGTRTQRDMDRSLLILSDKLIKAVPRLHFSQSQRCKQRMRAGASMAFMASLRHRTQRSTSGSSNAFMQFFQLPEKNQPSDLETVTIRVRASLPRQLGSRSALKTRGFS